MPTSQQPHPLDQKSLASGVSALTKIDGDLKEVVERFGTPPLWERTPGFATLLHIILEQQVSLASAKATFDKLTDATVKLTPERFLQFTDMELRGFGFSRQKISYGRALSEAILRGKLDLETLSTLDDESVRNEMTKIKGIGLWTANIYLLMALLRPNIWPSGDLALAKTVQRVKKLPSIPTQKEQFQIAAQWKPWRAVAARILWHFYLST